MYNLNFKKFSSWLSSYFNTLPPEENEHHHHCQHAHCDHEHLHNENHYGKAITGLTYGIFQFVFASISPMFILLNTLVGFYLGLNVYRSAWHALKEKKLAMTVLYSLSTLSIMLVSLARLYFPWLPMMSETAPLILGFWHLGEFLENKMVNKIHHQLDVLDCLPPTVFNIEQQRLTPIQDLKPNDKIRLTANSVIPVDGILEKDTYLYTKKINGSGDLYFFKAKSEVKSGMTVPDSNEEIEMTVTQNLEHSYLSLFAHNINHAHQEKAPIEKLVDKILSFFIPSLIAIASLSGIIIHHFFGPALALQCVISVLVSACPCALSLITPLAVKIGMSKAAEHGVWFKNSKDLQATAAIDHIVFDLNGTLTKGEISIKEFYIDDKYETYLSAIHSLESHSKHPVAQQIRSYIQQHFSMNHLVVKCSEIDDKKHSGIRGKLGNDWLMIGNSEMLNAHNIPLNDEIKLKDLYIVFNENIVGYIKLEDPLRDDALETISKLKELGKTIHICTGADKAYAERYAPQLGIDPNHICANAVGVATKEHEQSKTDYIHQLKQKGYHVAMVGDATNDAWAISSADIGIAVYSAIGDEETHELASIVIQKGLLFPIVTALDLAQKTSYNIFQNLMISLTYNSSVTLVAAGLFLSAGFALNPVLGVFLMILESSIVFANLHHLKQQDVIHAPTLRTRPRFFHHHQPHHCCGEHSAPPFDMNTCTIIPSH